MRTNTHIISLYPLTSEYLRKMDERLSVSGKQIVLSNITAKGYWGIFHQLRSKDVGQIYFPISDTNNLTLIPLYNVLGVLSGAAKKYIIMPDFSTRLLSPRSSIFGIVAILNGILMSSGLLIREYFWLKKISNLERTKISTNLSNRILYLKQTLWVGLQAGGSIAHARGVIKGLQAQNREIDLLSQESRLAVPAGKGLRNLESSSYLPYIIPRELNFCQFNNKGIDSLISMPYERYGAIYQRLYPGNFFGVVLSRIRKIPLIIEYNGSETWLAKNWGSGLTFSRYVAMAEDVSLKHAHLIVTVSDVLKDELIDRGVEPERIVNYPNGVDTNEFDPDRFSKSEIRQLRSDIGVPKNAILLTFVGTFGHWHGADFLAQVMTEYAKLNPQWYEDNNIYVCFVGDGVKRQSVESVIAKCSQKQRFIITGMVPHEMAPLYMAASDILMSPHVPNPDGSPFFGSPTKIFEYMASSRPVIASDLYQIGKLFSGAPYANALPRQGSLPTEDQCGILVKPRSETEIVQAVNFLVKNPKWRRAAGENARNRVRSRYTWKRHVEEIDRGLHRIIEGQKKPDSKTTKVLLNALHAKTGGGVTYLKNLLPLVSANSDFEFYICIHKDQLDILPKLDDRVHLHILNFKPGFWRLPFWEQIEIPKLARKIGADVTFSPANYGPFFAPNPVIMLRNALGVAFVERRPVKIAYWLLVSIGTFLSMMTCRRAIAVSKYARNSNFGPITGFIRNRLNIIPHGVNKAFSYEGSVSRREDYLLAVSDIYVQKNLKNLLLAIDILRLEKPDIKLKVAGRFIDENYHLELNRLILEKGLENNIEFLGSVYGDELVNLYRRCAVFVFPSTVETFGNPLIEAMASGAPIATSNTAAMPEVAGEAALYFNPHDVEDMASCIGQLLKDKELCKILSKKALLRAKNYSWEKTAEQTLDVLYQAVPEADE